MEHYAQRAPPARRKAPARKARKGSSGEDVSGELEAAQEARSQEADQEARVIPSFFLLFLAFPCF